MKKSGKVALIVIGIIAVIAVLLAAAGNSFARNRRQSLSSSAERYIVTKGELSFTAVGSGKIASADIKNVVSQGSISEIKVKIGDYVKIDDVLADITNNTGENDFLKSEYEGVVTAVPAGGYDALTGKPAASSFEISSINTLQMIIQATEKDIYKIQAGQKASIYIDALNLTVDGTVSRVSMAGKTAGDFSVYDVTVSFDKGDNNIYLGMTGSAKILIETKKDIVKVPVEAIIERDSKRYVLKSEWLDNMNRPQKDYYIEVKTGLSDSDFVEITQGDLDGVEILILPMGGNTAFPRMRMMR